LPLAQQLQHQRQLLRWRVGEPLHQELKHAIRQGKQRILADADADFHLALGWVMQPKATPLGQTLQS
jgi:hypothetical protein